MCTSKITHVSVEKLWGVKSISVDFDANVNIFIGTNGTNKTVFLSLIEGVLSVDIFTIADIDFDKIIIKFDDSAICSLTVAKVVQDEQVHLHYIFSDGDEFDVPTIPNFQRIYRKYREVTQSLRIKMHHLVNISWLSINRDNINPIEYESRDILERFKNMVDIKMNDLVRALGTYQLQLESEANAIANDFKKNVLSLMLYNQEFDTYNNDVINQFRLLDTKQLQTDLFRAFNTLGVAREKRDDIFNHIQKIKDSVDNLTNGKFSVDDAFVLGLARRTFEIIEISKEHESQTKQIFAPILSFWECLKRFMPHKQFEYQKESGRLSIILEENFNKRVPIELKSLSSGEKQLFILLTEALLQKENNYLFIADEPELSLHIDWQKRILQEMLTLNPNAQIIVATHSPEIAGNYPDKVVNMKNITYYGD